MKSYKAARARFKISCQAFLKAFLAAGEPSEVVFDFCKKGSQARVGPTESGFTTLEGIFGCSTMKERDLSKTPILIGESGTWTVHENLPCLR